MLASWASFLTTAGSPPSEAAGPERGGDLGPQDLERDLAMVAEVLGEIDRRHPARAELALDATAISQRLLHPFEEFGHPSRLRKQSRGPTPRCGHSWG